MRSKSSRSGQAWVAAVGVVLALASTGCGPELLEEQAQAEATQAPVALAQAGAGLTGEGDTSPAPQVCASCSPDPDDDNSGYPYYTLFWKANLLSLRCIDPSDMDGIDETYLVAEVTGDNAAETFWGWNYMVAGQTEDFDPDNPYPTYLQFQTYSVGAAGKTVAIWDESTGWFDAKEQIGVAYLLGKSGTFSKVVSGSGGSYELTYRVVSTGCAPRTRSCPTGL